MFSLNRRFPFFRKLVIAVFSIPLMFAGGSFLGGLAQSQTVGEVGSLDIPRNEFVGRYQSALEEYRRATGSEEIPQSIADRINNEVRSDLLSYYLMKAAIEQKGIHAPDTAVAAEIRQTPDFQDEDGNFSPALYTEFVSDRRYYQERVRDSIGREPVFRAMNAYPQERLREQLAAFRRQQRVVDEAVVPVSALTTVTLNVPPDDINLYYQRNSSSYRLREEATFEYVVLSLDEFSAGYTVAADEVRAAYDDYIAEQEILARRQASHIYIEDEALADEVAARAIAAPDEFAALAAEYSEDSGSAADGGLLGIIADGDLPPAMNEALFAMTVGEVHAPIETEEGGFSILKFDALISEDVPPFAEVEDEMARRARHDAARDDFEARAEELRDLAAIEYGSLVSLAAAVSGTVQVQATVYRDAAENPPPFNEETVLLDAFDPVVTADGENSAPIPVGDSSYLFVRAPRYQSAGLQPLDEVAGEIADIVRASYLASDMYRHLQQLHRPQTLTAALAGAAGDNFIYGDEVSLDKLLDIAQWDATHTLLLAESGEDEGALNTIDGDIAAPAAVDAGADEDAAAIDDFAVDRIYAVDLSYGLPAYVFLPEEDALRVYRVREIIDGEALASDYLVVDELLEDMTSRLTGVGYLDGLTSQYNYQFFNVPDVAAQ